MAQATGVDFTKIQFVNLSPPDAITALAKGDIDRWRRGRRGPSARSRRRAGSSTSRAAAATSPARKVRGLGPGARGVVASGKMLKENPNTLKAVLRAVRKSTDMLNRDRETCIRIVAREMKIDEELAREIMTYNVYSMEMNDKIVKG